MTIPAQARYHLSSIVQRTGRTLEDVTELYVERWAVRQYDGGLSEDEAARLAMLDVESLCALTR